MNNSQKFTSVREIIPIEIEKETVFDIVARDVNTYTHGFHKYPAKFIPHIPKWAISKYLLNTKNKTILDPFCGSGTTLVEGVVHGHNVIGIDIDPLSVLISKVKTTRINPKLLTEISLWVEEEIKSLDEGSFYPECLTIDHWFTPDAIKKLSKIRTVIDGTLEIFGTDKETRDIQDLLLVCFSSIIRKCSNADNESQKTYVSHTKIKEPEEVFSLFSFQLKYFIERAINFTKITNNSASATAVQASSTDGLARILGPSKIDLVVTSPPYIKAIDYIYNQMVELFWIGDRFQSQTQTLQNQKKQQYIGNKHILKAEYDTYVPNSQLLNIDRLDIILQNIYEFDRKNGHKHSYVTHKYFKEMENHFNELARNIDSGVHYIMVVGNSNVSGIFVNTADFLSEIAERNGFEISNKWGYKIKNRYMRFDRKGRGGIIEIDWILDLKKK